MVQGISGQGIGNPRMLIRKLFPFAGFPGRLFIVVCGKEIFASRILQSCWLRPEPVHQAEVRTQRGEGCGGKASQDSKEAVGFEFFNPGGKAGKAKHHHEDKGANDLHLVDSGPSGVGIELGEILHNRIQIKNPQFFPDSGKFRMKPYALGRVKMYFCLMQESQIFLMGLPVN